MWWPGAEHQFADDNNPKSDQTTSCLARGKEPLQVLEGAAGVRCIKAALIRLGLLLLKMLRIWLFFGARVRV